MYGGYPACARCTQRLQKEHDEHERAAAVARFRQRLGFDSEAVVAAYFAADPSKSLHAKLQELFILYPHKTAVLCEDGLAYIRKANTAALAARKLALLLQKK